MTRAKPFTGRYWRHVRRLNLLTSASPRSAWTAISGTAKNPAAVPGPGAARVAAAGALASASAAPGRSQATPAVSLPARYRTFLAVLTAQCRNGRIGGTGTGIRTAWMASAMPADCVLVTIEAAQRWDIPGAGTEPGKRSQAPTDRPCVLVTANRATNRGAARCAADPCVAVTRARWIGMQVWLRGRDRERGETSPLWCVNNRALSRFGAVAELAMPFGGDVQDSLRDPLSGASLLGKLVAMAVPAGRLLSAPWFRAGAW